MKLYETKGPGKKLVMFFLLVCVFIFFAESLSLGIFNENSMEIKGQVLFLTVFIIVLFLFYLFKFVYKLKVVDGKFILNLVSGRSIFNCSPSFVKVYLGSYLVLVVSGKYYFFISDKSQEILHEFNQSVRRET